MLERMTLRRWRIKIALAEAFQETQGLFIDNEPDLPLPPRFFDVGAQTDLDVVSYGFAGALRLGDRFSLGGGVSLMRGRWDNST